MSAILVRLSRALAAGAMSVASMIATPSALAGVRAGSAAGVVAPAASIAPAEWAAYTRKFLEPSGRIVDVERNRISHSEGQGYGLILAVKAGDRAAFDRILAFTVAHMRRHDDPLVSWIYDPRRTPRVADGNNATDGDILIAYALVLAAARWEEPRYLARAEPMIRAIGRSLLVRHDGFVVVRPALAGFDRSEQADGPVANLSYYVYGAFLVFETVDPRWPWREAWRSGLLLTNAVQTAAGRIAPVPDWVSLARERFLAPAEGFPKASGYEAVRIPLYMALGGRVPPDYFAAFDLAWSDTGGPSAVDLAGAVRPQPMREPGYRAIAALAACAARGAPIPPEIASFRPTTYFASSLHLLALTAVRETYPDCLRGTVDAAAASAEAAPG
jgi:endoglucanase